MTSRASHRPLASRSSLVASFGVSRAAPPLDATRDRRARERASLRSTAETDHTPRLSGPDHQVEGYQQLKTIARFPERRHAYGRRVAGGASSDLPVVDEPQTSLKESKSLVGLKKLTRLTKTHSASSPQLEELVLPVVDGAALARVARGGFHVTSNSEWLSDQHESDEPHPDFARTQEER